MNISSVAVVLVMASLILTNPQPSRALSSTPRAVIIFCHGSGDTGPGARYYVRSAAPSHSLSSLKESGVVFEFPSAVPRPYRLVGGQISSVWYDRVGGMDPRNPEDTNSIEPSARQLNDLIDDVVKRRGVPRERIALGGFSMGGGMALQTAARSSGRLGAVFAISSYLCDDSKVWTDLDASREKCGCVAGVDEARNALLVTPVFMSHGEEDDFVLPAWGERTASRLKESGADVKKFERIPGAGHEMIGEELSRLFDFLQTELLDE